MHGRYVAFIGSTETYGRFIEKPFPELLEKRLGVECVNFGVVNVGLDLYMNEPPILNIAQNAAVKVVQVIGAQNMSNRYYSVHPRRNDRFLRAGDRLEMLYPEVDFTDFHFNRHLLSTLRDISEDRFMLVVEELKQAWVARMKQLLTQLRGRVVLLWFAAEDPPQKGTASISDPAFVDRDMLDAIRPRVAHLLKVRRSEDARMEGTQGMIFSDYDICAAEETLGLRAHEEVANALEPVLQKVLGGEG